MVISYNHIPHVSNLDTDITPHPESCVKVELPASGCSSNDDQSSRKRNAADSTHSRTCSIEVKTVQKSTAMPVEGAAARVTSASYQIE